jgi:ribosome biogenesis GTPase
MDLEQLGWKDIFETEFEKFKSMGYEIGRVAIENKHAYTLFTKEGAIDAILPGKFLHKNVSQSNLPKVGDWVVFKPVNKDEKVVIKALLPRYSKIARKIPGKENQEQVLAANVDTAFLVQSFDQGVNLRKLDRYLVMVHEGGVRPVVILNKVDLAKEPEETITTVKQAIGDTPLLVVSATKARGIEEIKKFIPPGETVVFLGPSGVGKSSLINAIYGEEIQATIEVRESDAKGRHTTTWREMIILPDGGLVIDTPGMREFHIWVADEGIQEAFPEFFEIGRNCKFRDCSHTIEKGCAVLAAVESGQISRERHQSYVKLYNEIQYMNEEIKRHSYTIKRRTKRPRADEAEVYDED